MGTTPRGEIQRLERGEVTKGPVTWPNVISFANFFHTTSSMPQDDRKLLSQVVVKGGGKGRKKKVQKILSQITCTANIRLKTKQP